MSGVTEEELLAPRSDPGALGGNGLQVVHRAGATSEQRGGFQPCWGGALLESTPALEGN